MTKKTLVNTFYHILYQPKGVPTSSHNFSGSGGTLCQSRERKMSGSNNRKLSRFTFFGVFSQLPAVKKPENSAAVTSLRMFV